MKKIIALVLTIITLAIFSSCAENPGQNASGTATSDTSQPVTSHPFNPYTFIDALNEEVKVEKPPERVVALMGGFAETWLLAGGELVGVTDDATLERKLDLPNAVKIVGKYNAPNTEEILALNPDFVILSSETEQHIALKDTLNNAGIQAVYFKVTVFEDYLAMLKTCTEITGQPQFYQENGVKTQNEIIDIIDSAEIKNESPNVLYLITFSGGAKVQNSATMTGKMLADLGCVNIADKNPSLLKEFNIENIINEDPDFIFVVPMGNDDNLAMQHLEQTIESNPAWNNLTAVKNKRYILLPKEKFLYKPNAKWNESYKYLSDILYGDE